MIRLADGQKIESPWAPLTSLSHQAIGESLATLARH